MTYIPRPRLHCHTSFKHYQMYHRDSDSGYGNSVFNYTYNINGGQICGGGFWGGVLGGIGMGIGNFLGSILGGFGFGGFGFGGGCFGGGMFGGGMPFFGGGMPFLGGGGFFGGGMMSGPYAISGDNGSGLSALFGIGKKKKKGADGAGGNDVPKTVTVEKDCENPDGKKYSELTPRETSLNKNFTIEALNSLYKDAVEGLEESKKDEHHKDNDITNFTQLIERLKQLATKNGLELQDDKFVEKSANNSVDSEGAGNSGSAYVNGNESGIRTENPHASEYEDGLINATDEDMNNIKKNDKIDIIDTSDVDDFEDANIEDINEKIITVKSTSGITIKYKYHETNKFGEKIFVSNKSQQHYVLQKTSDGKFKLMQYSWLHGHETPDVTDKNKDKDNGFEKK